jgi:hypothetical protein
MPPDANPAAADANQMVGLKSRPFAYADIYRHPPMSGLDLPPELASIRKNESSCLVVLRDGTWLTTWSQGSSEGALDEKIVCATSRDLGLTWSEPRRIVASTPEWRRSYGCPFVVPATGRLYVSCTRVSNTGTEAATASVMAKATKRTRRRTGRTLMAGRVMP